MYLDRAGREYLAAPYTADVDDPGPAEVFVVGAWHPCTLQDGHVVFLAAGPDATDNPAGTVVLALGRNIAEVRFADSPEVIVRGGGVITVR